VDDDLDPVIICRDLLRDLGAIVGRSVVDQENPDVDAFLTAENAGLGVPQVVAIVLAGNDNAD